VIRIQKILWSILCGAALGVAGCGDDSQPEYGAPVDVSADDDVDGDEVQDAVDVTGEDPGAQYYGPAPSP